jgi:NAD(P)-dependent dehydrogenase (short-subunit alcohol dehydrogenase family)
MTTKPTTLITGGAKRIGAAIARHLAGQGHNIVLHYNQSHDAAEKLAAELRELDVTVTLVRADLEHLPTMEAFWKHLPPCTTIIHNASRWGRDTIDSFTPADLRSHLVVNLEAPILLTQGFLAQMPAHAQGNVILLGDDALGWSNSPEFFTYAVSKHSWSSLVDLLAAACAPQVRMNIIALAATLPGDADGEAMFKRLAEKSPLKRTSSVPEVLTAIDFVLASPGMTGQRIGLGNGMALTTSRALKQ